MSDTSQFTRRGTAQRNGWGTRKLVTMALFVALSLILSFIEIPLFPAAPFLKYDASAVAAAFAAFGFGPASGIVVGVVSAAIHGLVMGDPWGSLMTCIVVICWVLPIGLAHRVSQTRAAVLVGLVLGGVLSIVGAVAGNLAITPIYTGTDLAAVLAMVVPILLPFNILKAVINVILSFILYGPVEKLVSRS